MKTLRTRPGQTLVLALLLMVIAAIIVPLMVMRGQNESKWTIKQARSTTAYHLAEAGQDRAIWYLVQSQTNWQNALSGTAISGYAGDMQYSDVSGGLYTISFSSGPSTSQVTALTKGRDNSTNEFRTIKAVYSGSAFQSGFVAAGEIEYEENFTVHWGQVTSFTSIDLDNASAPRFPIRDSKGAVDPWKTNPTPPTSNPAYNYVAYDQTLTTPPQIDFDYYRAKAKATRMPEPNKDGDRTSQWAGTGYFDGPSGKEVNFKSYNFNCSTCVVFIESSKAKITDTGAARGLMHLEGFIVYTNNIHIHANGADPYTVDVPTDAWKQYTAGTPIDPDGPDTAATGEYPGDGGYHTVTPTYTMPNALYDGAGNNGVAFHGFLYSNSFDCSGGNNILVGQFNVGLDETEINTMTIYYDPAVAQNVHYAKNPITRVSWDEIKSTWP